MKRDRLSCQLTTSSQKMLSSSEKCDDLSLRQPRHHLTPLSIHNYIDDALLTISSKFHFQILLQTCSDRPIERSQRVLAVFKHVHTYGSYSLLPCYHKSSRYTSYFRTTLILTFFCIQPRVHKTWWLMRNSPALVFSK